MSPTVVLQKAWKSIRKEWKTAFMAAVCIGLVIHMPIMLSDIPNHDGLDSLYFDQNMITSGRWFLMVACGFSSFYSVPWFISLLGLFFLGLASVALTELMEVKETWAIVLSSGLLVAFPALTSTFAYVFTLDGYMLALLLAVMSVLLTKKYKHGFLGGGVCLAFSMGIYQAYLPFAIILSAFAVWQLCIADAKRKERGKKILSYLCMGVFGALLYYLILKILLLVQGKELAGYQGINDMTSAGGVRVGLGATIYQMYRDFAAFTLKGRIVWNSPLTAAACGLLLFATLATLIHLVLQRKWWKTPWFFVIILGIIFALPLGTNIILLISPSVNYHLLMRYQWVLFLIGMVAFISKYAQNGNKGLWIQWVAMCSAFVLLFSYALADNIAYTNLQKKYEKTYAYCMRLLDRIEQTPGYYQGIPIAMIGVVGDEQFPVTDYTQAITSGMIGMSGDMLLYTGPNYQKFISNYLGASLNVLPAEAMAEMYYDEEYVAMDSFPGENSIRIIDGIMYIKTENTTR